MSYAARVTVTGLERHLKLSSLIHMRIAVPVVLNFILSVCLSFFGLPIALLTDVKLFFSLLSLAFQANDVRPRRATLNVTISRLPHQVRRRLVLLIT